MTGPYTGSPASNGQSPDEADGELKVLSIVNLVIRRRRIVLLAILAMELLMLVFALRKPLRYTTTVTFMPEGQRATGLSSLAGQFGFGVPGSDGLNSPQFYAELVKSPAFLGTVVEAPLGDSAGRALTLMDVYQIQGPDPRVRRAQAVQKLGGDVNISAAPRTTIITLNVTADNPELSTRIAETILADTTRFNQHTRQGRAAAERRFVEKRLADVRDSLRAAEDRMQAFLLENRDYRTSPTLQFRYTRLERDVQSQQLLLSTLGPSYEQAKIEEVRDTPVLTVVRRPEAPVWPNPRGRVRLMILGIILGFGVGILIIPVSEGVRRVQVSPDPAARELSELTADITGRIRERKFVRALFGSRS